MHFVGKNDTRSRSGTESIISPRRGNRNSDPEVNRTRTNTLADILNTAAQKNLKSQLRPTGNTTIKKNEDGNEIIEFVKPKEDLESTEKSPIPIKKKQTNVPTINQKTTKFNDDLHINVSRAKTSEPKKKAETIFLTPKYEECEKSPRQHQFNRPKIPRSISQKNIRSLSDLAGKKITKSSNSNKNTKNQILPSNETKQSEPKGKITKSISQKNFKNQIQSPEMERQANIAKSISQKNLRGQLKPISDLKPKEKKINEKDNEKEEEKDHDDKKQNFHDENTEKQENQNQKQQQQQEQKSSKRDSKFGIDFNDIACKMKDPVNGVAIKTRKVRLRKFSNCFVAEQAVTWFCTELKIKNRTEAVMVGKMMQNLNIFQNVGSSDYSFQDKNLYFRFVE